MGDLHVGKGAASSQQVAALALNNLQFHIATACRQAHAMLQGIDALIPERPDTTAARTLAVCIGHQLEEIEDQAIETCVAALAQTFGLRRADDGRVVLYREGDHA